MTLRQVDELSRSFPEKIGYDYLCRAETGAVVPPIEKLITLSRIYDIPTQRFLDIFELAHIEGDAPVTGDPEECRQLGKEAFKNGDYKKAYACFLAGLAILQNDEGTFARADRSQKISALQNNVAAALIRLGKYRIAQQHAEAALENRKAGPFVASRSLTLLSAISYQLDRLRLAEALAVASVRLSRDDGNEEQIGDSLQTLANARFDLGDHRPASALYRRALALYEQHGAHAEAASAIFNLANCHHEMGDYDLADERYRDGLQRAETIGNRRLKARGLMDQGRSLYIRRRLDEARSPLAESRALSMSHDYRSEAFHSTYYLWRISVEQRGRARAIELFHELKSLRLKLDERSEEILSFDDYLELHRARRRGGRKQ